MTSSSNLDTATHKSNRIDSKTVQLLNQIIIYLSEFKGHLERKFNLIKLSNHLKLSSSDIDNIVYLILNFQQMFEEIFKHHKIKLKRESNQRYLIVEKKKLRIHKEFIAPDEIILSKSSFQFFNDFIYTFKFVKKGKGFDITINGSSFMNKLKELKDMYPYFFVSNGNGLIYPSKLGLELGEVIISYNKINKYVNKIKIKNSIIKVDKNG